MRTKRTIWPDPCLEPLASRILIVKDRIVKVAGHCLGSGLMLKTLADQRCFVNGIVAQRIVE